MSNYSPITDFSSKDNLASGNPEKAISGADVDGEFNAISTHIASKIDLPGGPTSGQVLTWNGSAWVASDPTVSGSVITLTSDTATTSGTAVDIAVPSTTQAFVLMFEGVSTSGTADLWVQLGTGSTAETSGYTSRVTQLQAGANDSATSTSAFRISNGNSAATVWEGQVHCWIKVVADDTWTAMSQMSRDTPQHHIGTGSKTLLGALDQVTLTTSNGTDTFDAGTIAIAYM